MYVPGRPLHRGGNLRLGLERGKEAGTGISLLRGGLSTESSEQRCLPPEAVRFLGQTCSEICSQRGPQSPSPRAARGLGPQSPSPWAARGLGAPEPLAAHCSLPRTDRPTRLSHWSLASLADEPKLFPLASSDAASAASVLPAFAHPPPLHLLHPSEVNSSENFPWEQFPLLIMPAAPAQLLLSGSLQQRRRLTLA